MTDERKTLKLNKPVQFGSETISELNIRAPSAKDLDDMPVGEMKWGDFRRLLGVLSGQNDVVTGALSPSDMGSAIGVMSDFLQNGPQTGDKPSG